jgi:hypothetical protein
VSSTEQATPEALVMPDGTPAATAYKRLREQVEFERQNNPTNGMNLGQLALAGIGKSFADTGRGL